jgi:hypothetical protein
MHEVITQLQILLMIDFNPAIDPRSFSIPELMGYNNYMMFLVLVFTIGSAGLIFFCKLYCTFLIYSYFTDIVNDIVVSQIANLFSFVACIKYGFFQDQDQII